MDQHTTFVAFDDSKRNLVAAILRPGEREPEQREFPKDPHLIRRFFRRLTREGSVRACYEAGVSGYDLHRQITACGEHRRYKSPFPARLARAEPARSAAGPPPPGVRRPSRSTTGC